MTTKQDFLDWKKHPVTEAVFNQIQQLLQIGVDELINTAGIDSGADRERRGKIAGLSAVLDVQFGEIGGEDD